MVTGACWRVQIKDMAESKRVNNAIRNAERVAAGGAAGAVDGDAPPFQAIVISGHFWPTLNVRGPWAVHWVCSSQPPVLVSWSMTHTSLRSLSLLHGNGVFVIMLVSP